jgi:uncharacterized protein YdaL
MKDGIETFFEVLTYWILVILFMVMLGSFMFYIYNQL